VPQHLYESARLDGAGRIRQFFSITVPMVSSSTFFMLITGIMAAIKEWTYIMLLTGGGPGGTSTVFGMLAYQFAFPLAGFTQDLGVASSVSVVMLVIAVCLSVSNWKLQDKWVYYD
jgi:multiple sugar transport system permease protein